MASARWRTKLRKNSCPVRAAVSSTIAWRAARSSVRTDVEGVSASATAPDDGGRSGAGTGGVVPPALIRHLAGGHAGGALIDQGRSSFDIRENGHRQPETIYFMPPHSAGEVRSAKPQMTKDALLNKVRTPVFFPSSSSWP